MMVRGLCGHLLSVFHCQEFIQNWLRPSPHGITSQFLRETSPDLYSLLCRSIYVLKHQEAQALRLLLSAVLLGS